ncbi:hypothetical protein M0L20_07820 [Spirosoma sp. RP8]|uniref:Uncharacterized protein n=1 Tax=Spirosoma liriopis TaxID=2937440 RepID=A0ABT0HHW9_9BACT|nr:hypothetical protein [Spirosoma liriopis]MCK8491756.1 hypothetical protein [Spirosoma liriopis]
MNQGFKLRYDQMRQSNPTGSDPQTVDQNDHSSPGHVRNLCFNWPDGKRMFFNYAYLIACEFNPESDKNAIQLVFSSHIVTLHGYGLDPLFISLLDHLPRFITMIDERYVSTTDQDMIVTAIAIGKN